jgi:hypothetical protein
MAEMRLKFNINTMDNSLIGYSASVLLHIGIVILFLFLLNISGDRSRINPQFVQVIPQELMNNINTGETPQQHAKSIHPEEHEINSNSDADKKTIRASEIPHNAFYSLSNINADTTSLNQVYSEPTLNVTMKYPAGWTYMDQNVNKKLDGVTFWSTDGNYSPPPYINLEVRDKDLFDASRYKYNIKTWRFTIYYNDPEEMENQVSQIIYIRTNSGEDFSLKLIMNGKEEFKSFQPIFFGIIKSFKFGRDLF